MQRNQLKKKKLRSWKDKHLLRDKKFMKMFFLKKCNIISNMDQQKVQYIFFSFDKKYSFSLCSYKAISFSEPIVGSRSSQSLDDITLDEDTDLEKQFEDFLEPEETVCFNCTVNIYIQYTNIYIFAIQISSSKTPISLGFCQGFLQPVSANLTLYKYFTCTWLVHFIGNY